MSEHGAANPKPNLVSDSWCLRVLGAASLAAVTGWVKVPTMGGFSFAHLA